MKTGGAAQAKVLVVDDEHAITELVSMALRYEGFDVTTAHTGAEALQAAEAEHADLAILDVMLPDTDGFTLASRLRARRSDIPILFLTARDAEQDKIHGLTIGGDDYLTKPFSVGELVARLKAVLRRSGMTEQQTGPLRFDDLELDEKTRDVRRAGRHIELTVTEFRLLHYLMLNATVVLTRAQLLDHVWTYDFNGDARILETYVSYLRRKLEEHGSRLVHTVRGVGYVLRESRSDGRP
ncbi:response regulator transcription factor [Amycolatopsis sp. NPDC004378]